MLFMTSLLNLILCQICVQNIYRNNNLLWWFIITTWIMLWFFRNTKCWYNHYHTEAHKDYLNPIQSISTKINSSNNIPIERHVLLDTRDYSTFCQLVSQLISMFEQVKSKQLIQSTMFIFKLSVNKVFVWIWIEGVAGKYYWKEATLSNHLFYQQLKTTSQQYCKD